MKSDQHPRQGVLFVYRSKLFQISYYRIQCEYASCKPADLRSEALTTLADLRCDMVEFKVCQANNDIEASCSWSSDLKKHEPVSRKTRYAIYTLWYECVLCLGEASNTSFLVLFP